MCDRMDVLAQLGYRQYTSPNLVLDAAVFAGSVEISRDRTQRLHGLISINRRSRDDLMSEVLRQLSRTCIDLMLRETVQVLRKPHVGFT